MAMTSDIKRLTEDIVESFDARRAFLGDLTKGMADMLSGFGERRREMAAELRKTFDTCESERLREVSELKKETHDMLGGFRAEHKEMADSWRRMSLTMEIRREGLR